MTVILLNVEIKKARLFVVYTDNRVFIIVCHLQNIITELKRT